MITSVFGRRVAACVRAVPWGRVCTYGSVARMAGNARAARQVVRLLHACSEKENLPWHRIVNRLGEIGLPLGRGGEEQRRLLEQEGVWFDGNGRIDLERFSWRPSKEERDQILGE